MALFMIVVFALALSSLIPYLVILGDMFKRNVLLGFGGLFITPILYFYSIAGFRGKKAVFTTWLWAVSLLPLGFMIYSSVSAALATADLRSAWQETRLVSCDSHVGVSYEGADTVYEIECTEVFDPARQVAGGMDLMGDARTKAVYDRVVSKLIPPYKDGDLVRHASLELTLRTPSLKMVSCWSIRPPGVVADARSVTKRDEDDPDCELADRIGEET